IGILGLPNVGKSTFFNVLTKSQAQAENFPFCTIDPNESRVPVSDTRFDWLVEHYKPVSKVPAYLNVTDIAGLVKGEVDPCRDLEIISDELFAKDLQSLAAILDKVEKLVTRAGDKTLKVDYDTLMRVKKDLEEKKPIRLDVWNEREIEVMRLNHFCGYPFNVLLFIGTEQAFVFDCEADRLSGQSLGKGLHTQGVICDSVEGDFRLMQTLGNLQKNKWLPKIKEWIDHNDPGASLIPFSGALETKLLDMPEDEREKYLKEKQTSSNLDKSVWLLMPLPLLRCCLQIVHTGYKALQLEYFFTSGKDEVKAWTIQKGTLAPKAAGRIHTDFEKGFIMAEVMKVADLMELGDENK
ncbi:putative GTP-binding protein YchF, partial [Teladorsagia circumcincta]